MGRQTLLPEGQPGSALQESQQQPHRGEDHVNRAVGPTRAEMLAVKVGWTRAGS